MDPRTDVRSGAFRTGYVLLKTDFKQDNLIWQPSATLDALQARSKFMIALRKFFTAKGYLEVETPIMGRYGVTDPYLSNIKANFRGKDFALQTSPEYHMKRLLASGSGPIFQLARVFRDDELGRWHNPEFTLLEWYQLGVDHLYLLDEVNQLLQYLLECPPIQIVTYQSVFEKFCDFNPHEIRVQDVHAYLQRHDLDQVLDLEEHDLDQYLFLLMSHVIEPALAKAPGPTAVIDFPCSQASLAKIQSGFAARFEVYFRGIELANGFYELTDPFVQANRFHLDNQIRKKQAKPFVEIDSHLLQALDHGLPPCAGVALGVDRLLALALQYSSISACLAFDFLRA